MARWPAAVIAVAAPLAVSACAGERIGMPPPVPAEVRSAPADSYPNINIVPNRPGSPRPPEEVEEIQRELEQLRERHAR